VKVIGHWGKPLLMFPTSMGNANQNNDFDLFDTIRERINRGEMKVYNVDSIDFQSFYAKDLSAKIKIYNYSLYMRFLSEELVPWIQRESNVHRIAVGGCSFGGFHAATFAFKFPDLVYALISMSGAYNIRHFMKGYYDDNVYFNNPVDFVPNVENWKYSHMKIVLGTSDWDICRQDNVEFSRLLSHVGIDHWYDEKKWTPHDWPLWKMMFPEYINKLM
jgi:esterase/lipase superfamily enzyme